MWIPMSRLLPFLVALMLALAACGDDGTVADPAPGDDDPAGDADDPADDPDDGDDGADEEDATEDEDLPGMVLGELASLTGAGAAFGESHHNGATLAVEEINEAGGIPGIGEITLVTEDTASDATQAVNAANKLINQDQVSAILGAVMSANTLATVPITQRAGVPQITALSSAPPITEQGSEFIFRVQLTADQSASALARYFVEQGLSPVAILNDTNEFGTNYADVAERTLEEVGDSVAVRQTYVTGDRDFTAQLLQVERSGARSLVISGHFEEAALIVRSMRDMGLDVVPGGPDAISDPHIFDLVDSEVLEGLVFTNSYLRTLPDPRIEEYVERYESEFGILSNNGDALAYDAVYVIAAAVEAAGNTERQAIRDALASISYEGLTGTIEFDENGDTARDPYIIEMHGDESHSILSAP